ncbi:hypothetical protein ACFVT6_20035 [Streptomyces sp. NPDC058049]|uniref:hypothetical protein n=1 Tax=Streptomyces sp. NPDC058049 TaxID=3346314 RepID=UPI0036E4CDFB
MDRELRRNRYRQLVTLLEAAREDGRDDGPGDAEDERDATADRALATYARPVPEMYGSLDLGVLTPDNDQSTQPSVDLREVLPVPSVRADPPPVVGEEAIEDPAAFEAGAGKEFDAVGLENIEWDEERRSAHGRRCSRAAVGTGETPQAVIPARWNAAGGGTVNVPLSRIRRWPLPTALGRRKARSNPLGVLCQGGRK